MDRQEWHDHVLRYGTLRTYRNFKQDLYFENYLDLDLSGAVIRVFTKLRAGLLGIEVNEGRWAKPPIEYSHRLCRLCNLRQVEDEEHLLFVCPVWGTYRQQLSNHTSFVQKDLKAVCTSVDPEFIRILVRYLNVVLAERAEILSVL